MKKLYVHSLSLAIALSGGSLTAAVKRGSAVRPFDIFLQAIEDFNSGAVGQEKVMAAYATVKSTGTKGEKTQARDLLNQAIPGADTTRGPVPQPAPKPQPKPMPEPEGPGGKPEPAPKPAPQPGKFEGMSKQQVADRIEDINSEALELSDKTSAQAKALRSEMEIAYKAYTDKGGDSQVIEGAAKDVLNGIAA